MTEDLQGPAVFACCSAGIGRWFWVAWASEADARGDGPVLASGFEKNADAAARKAAESVGPGAKRLPTRWASGFRKRGGPADSSLEKPAAEGKPKSRLGRRGGTPGNRTDQGKMALAFLYCASEGDRPGEVAVSRHRIVRQNPRTFHVDREPFREEEGADLQEGGRDPSKPRTLAVDRDELRREGRVPHRGSFFYATEEDGIRDVHASLTNQHAWCATLGLKFPCSTESVKAAYRRLARTTHPDAGGADAEFREVERAYRDALAYFTFADDEPTRAGRK